MEWLSVCAAAVLRMNFTCTPPFRPRVGTKRSVGLDFVLPPREVGRNDRASKKGSDWVRAKYPRVTNPQFTTRGKRRDSPIFCLLP